MPPSDHEIPSDAPVIFPPPQGLRASPRRASDDPPWTFWNVLALAVIAIVSIWFFEAIAILVAKHGMQSPSIDKLEKLARNPLVVLPALMAAYAVLVGAMVAVVHTSGRPFWKTIAWNFPARAALGYGTLGVSLAVLIGLTSKLLPIPKSLPIDSYFTDATSAYIMAIFGVTVAPLVEELFFRGFLYPVIARQWGAAASVGITALCFTLIHESQLGHAWAPLLLLWFVGLLLTAVRAWTKSVGASFCVHVGYNFTLFVLMYIATDHFRHLEKLT